MHYSDEYSVPLLIVERRRYLYATTTIKAKVPHVALAWRRHQRYRLVRRYRSPILGEASPPSSFNRRAEISSRSQLSARTPDVPCSSTKLPRHSFARAMARCSALEQVLCCKDRPSCRSTAFLSHSDQEASSTSTTDPKARLPRGEAARPLATYSARSNTAVGVRAARRPGIAATMLANTRAPSPIPTTTHAGTLGSGTAWMPFAKRSHKRRPTTTPSGRPIIVPIATEMLDCQATIAASWRPDRPSVFSTARSRRRRPTDATRVIARAATAPPASPTPRIVGMASIDPEFTISVGRRTEIAPPAEPWLTGLWLMISVIR